MRYDKRLMGLISKLERIVAGNCYSEYTEAYFYYPLTQCVDGENRKLIWSIERDLGVAEMKMHCTNGLRSLYYTFGSNNLEIARAIAEELNFLEDRYGLNFIELEKEYEAKSKKR